MEGNRNRLRWLLVIGLVIIAVAVAIIFLISGQRANFPADVVNITSTAIAMQNATAAAQSDATQTNEADLLELSQTANAFTSTATSNPTETATSTGMVSQTEIFAAPSFTPTPTKAGLSAVQQTATALANVIALTAITPTSRPIGGGETATPTAAAGGDEPTATPTPLPNTGGGEDETATAAAGGENPTEAPTDTVTPTPLPTASSTPLVVAEANLLIRSDVSGDVIGDGTLRIYAPNSARYPETSRVELELHLDNLYITPTPTGERGTPVPRSTSVAGNGSSATATPYVPIITDQGIPVYQRMGATLLCAAQSFKGCDAGREQGQAKIIASEVTSWSWIISPEEAAAGLQDLELDVWLVERNLDGNLEYLDLPGTPYHFQIEVNPAGGSSLPFIIIIAVVVVGLVGGGYVLSQRNKPASVPLKPQKNAPLVFISYRRGPSWGQARSIEQSLRERGANVFIDIDDINEGRFAETIANAIRDCDYFVAVLAPGTLDSPWVRREISAALAQKKIIVPLLVDGFRLDAESIPTEIKDIASHNAITVLPEFYQEAMNRLAERFLRLGDKGTDGG